MTIKLRLETDESRKRWELIKEASEEVNNWDELRKAEAYRRTKRTDKRDVNEAESKVTFDQPPVN
jgi:hypothetical protein